MKKILLMFLSLIFLAGCSSTSTDDKKIDILEEEKPEVILTGSLETYAHDVSGNVKIYEDGTLEITNFNYDGLAPDVYLALGHITDDFLYQILLSEELEEAYEDETYTMIIPETVDINNYSALSVWCHEFAEDFGSTALKK